MEIKEEIIKLLDDKQVEDIVCLNFKDKSPFLDYFFIGSVRNARMANAVLNFVEEFCDEHGIKVNHIDNGSETKWFLIDCGSFVVHIFYDEERYRYDLEGLWKDLIEK
ncbi:MAG: ribosome silencing factor [Erysipelotrichaceae bacterium]|nr:ribosome silencing factor [Erysipelotrichaceae bacterium]